MKGKEAAAAEAKLQSLANLVVLLTRGRAVGHAPRGAFPSLLVDPTAGYLTTAKLAYWVGWKGKEHLRLRLTLKEASKAAPTSQRFPVAERARLAKAANWLVFGADASCDLKGWALRGMECRDPNCVHRRDCFVLERPSEADEWPIPGPCLLLHAAASRALGRPCRCSEEMAVAANLDPRALEMTTLAAQPDAWALQNGIDEGQAENALIRSECQASCFRLCADCEHLHPWFRKLRFGIVVCVGEWSKEVDMSATVQDVLAAWSNDHRNVLPKFFRGPDGETLQMNKRVEEHGWAWSASRRVEIHVVENEEDTHEIGNQMMMNEEESALGAQVEEFNAPQERPRRIVDETEGPAAPCAGCEGTGAEFLCIRRNEKLRGLWTSESCWEPFVALADAPDAFLARIGQGELGKDRLSRIRATLREAGASWAAEKLEEAFRILNTSLTDVGTGYGERAVLSRAMDLLVCEKREHEVKAMTASQPCRASRRYPCGVPGCGRTPSPRQECEVCDARVMRALYGRLEAFARRRSRPFPPQLERLCRLDEDESTDFLLPVCEHIIEDDNMSQESELPNLTRAIPALERAFCARCQTYVPIVPSAKGGRESLGRGDEHVFSVMVCAECKEMVRKT